MLSINPIPSLPRYAGRHNVGSTEFEIPVSEINPRTTPPDSHISTVKFRLFYPTDATSTKDSITWIPPPQKRWIQAFSTFLGASLGWSSIINPVLSVMNYITIPAFNDAPLRQGRQPQRYPLAMFSHGLAGNCNMYSAVCGSLASCGIICVTAEHRDGSSPISYIRGPGGKIESEIPYQKYSHTPSVDVFNGRNRQLRVRLWELDLIYSALTKLDEGQNLSNYASDCSAPLPSFKSSMDFTSGHVAWLGHSFGAVTITQFVKSIYYRKSLPSPKPPSHIDENDWTPLYTPSPDSKLIEQITPSSPITLLDVWTMPFRAPSTQWLWEKPFPCYDRDSSSPPEPNTLAIMSAEFYNYTDLRKRTQALLSHDPVQAEKQLAEESESSSQQTRPTPSSPTISTPPNKVDTTPTAPEPDTLPVPALTTTSLSSSRTSSPASATHLSPPSLVSSPSSSTTSLSTPPSSTPKPEILAPKLYHIPASAHLSQSDFGLLFPTLTRVLMKAVDPEGTIILNVRGILAAMCNAGLDVCRIDQPRTSPGWFGLWGTEHVKKEQQENAEEQRDRILSGDKEVEGTGGRWIEIPLVF